jgi:hypothetical protein
VPASPQFGGADSLRALSQRAARFAAADPLRREAEAALAAVVPEVRREVKSTTDRLPTRGGLAAIVEDSRIDGLAFRRGGGVGVRIRASNRRLKDPAAINRGRVRHPTGWRVKSGRPAFQNVQPGWFTDAANAVGPDLRRRLQAAVRKAIDTF